MKKIFSIVLAISLSISLCACKNGTTAKETGKTSNTPEGVVETSNACIKIKDYAINQVKNQANQPLKAITIYCEYTNTGNAEHSMFMSGQIKAFQNGFELKSPTGYTTTSLISTDIRDYDSYVQPGYSYTTYYNFMLEDETSPVTVKVISGTESSEITYDLVGGTNPNESTEPGVVEMENVHLKINDCQYGYYGLDSNYRQYVCAVIRCEYTNKSDKEQSLNEVLEMHAYQNDRELEPTSLYANLSQIDKFTKDKISPNETCITGFYFDANSDDGNITVKVTDHHGTQLTETEVPIG
jgi:hypothetical protein